MRIAVLGPGGVGGLLAAALSRAGEDVTIVARESTRAIIAAEGVSVSSGTLGDFTARPRALTRLSEPVDALLVATKAAGLQEALARIDAAPRIVLPLLNGLDHIALLRERFAPESVLAGTIRVEADRPAPGVVVHTSPFLLVEMASRYETAAEPMRALAAALSRAGVEARGEHPIDARSEACVMWSKLVRLNALACTTSAYDCSLGEIREQPALRADLVGAIEESCAAGRAEGADNVEPQKALEELARAHATLGSSMQRDIAAGRAPELDAIPGSVLRAAARHGLRCPTIERLVATILARVESVER
ncbi:MAG TPA: 2-dehydropantoate 2-reductase [Solirubrobacteraceae bacterium]|jgi:2-dehydropantoate 2-reductase|nr:2-dehydropantoate 2-reductase [Solirubrobacteraceae bacterium]